MFKLLCVCIFVAKYASGYHYEFYNELTNNDIEEYRKKLLSYFQESSWSSHSPMRFGSSFGSSFGTSFGTSFDAPITIIEYPTIDRTYRTEINVQQSTHPYLFQIMQMIPIKGQISFNYIYQKLFQYFLALQKFRPTNQTLNTQLIIQILQFVFPELGNKVYEIAKYPIGPPMLRALFEMIFPGMSKADIDFIFRNVQTTKDLIINLVLYLCPTIRDDFQWNEDLPTDEKLNTILRILFPGETSNQLLNGNFRPGDFQNNMYNFLDLLFQGKLLPKSSNTIQKPTPNGPEWINFLTVLQQNNIDYLTLPKDVLFNLFSNFNTPQFNIYLTKLKNQIMKPNQMDGHMIMVWTQFLNDLKNHKLTLNDMPPEIKVFLQQHQNPQELIKILTDSIGLPGVPGDLSSIQLNPQTMELGKKFIYEIMSPKGDITHFPKQLLDFFNTQSQKPNSSPLLDNIFNGLSINPKIAVKWNTFFDKLRNGLTTLDHLPSDIRTSLMNFQHPEEFLRTILKLKDSNMDTNFLQIGTNPHMLALWKKYIQDVAANKANIRNIPQELLQYFYKLSANPANAEYIKLLFSPDQINPKTLNIWNQFVNDLKSHKVDLKDMPSEIIQLMSKYKSPDEFFKVFLPQTNVPVNMDLTPDETVKDQWKHWISNLQNHKASVLETPKELKDFFTKLSPSKDYQTTLKEINSINPDLLMKWKQFVTDLKSHRVDLKDMPSEIIQLMSKYQSPDEFFKVFLPQTNVPVNMNLTPDETVKDQWKQWTSNLQKQKASVLETPKELKDFFTKLSPSKDYQTALKEINFFNPDLLMKWKQFVTDLKSHRVDLKDMPSEIIQLMSKYQSPDEFFKVFLPQTNVPVNMDVTPDETVKDQWNHWTFDLQNRNASVLETPKELKDFIQKLSDSKDYLTTLKEINSINPDLLMKWKQFVTDLKSHRVDLQAMPSDIIQLMSKYRSPEEFFKVFLPQTNVPVNMDLTPDETVKDQWNHWTLNLQNRNTSVFETPKELKDFIQKLSPSKDYQTTLQEIDSINPDLLTKWKEFMGDLEQHKKSLYTMPQDLKKYLFEMKTPQEFVNLIFKTLSPPLNDLIPTPTENLTSDWKRFVEGIKEGYLLDGEVIDGVSFPYDLSTYLVNASNDVNYKHAVNNIYQMDAYQKTGFEDFVEKMHHDYYLNLLGLPEKLFYFFAKFEYFPDMFRSILAWYPNYEIKEHIADDPELGMLWAQTLYNLKINKTEIPPLFKLLIKLLTKDTPLESQIDEVIKLHESNALVSRVEKFWSEAKNEVKVHDGLEVFLQFLDKLGYYYGSSQELCDERSRILKTLDRVRKGFAAKSECTANKVFAD